MKELTKKEKSVIRRLKSIARDWPDTIWVYANSGLLSIMRYDEDGNTAILPNGGVDPDYEIDAVFILSGGGDW